MKIPDHEYRKIINLMPIIVIDYLIYEHGNKSDDVLLVRRKNNPLSGQWWLPGGRIYKNEPVNEAVYRILSDETGLNPEYVSTPEFLWFYDARYEKSAWNCDTHTISLIFETSIKKKEYTIELDDQSDRYKFGNIPQAVLDFLISAQSNINIK
jgi:colanic acid biosynthesis protein WcaH